MIKYAFIVTCLLLLSPCARAQETSGGIDFSQPVMDLNGPALDCDELGPDGKCTKAVEMTLGRLCGQALSVPIKNEVLARSVQRGILARRIFAGGKVKLTSDEITLIKDGLALLSLRTSLIADAVSRLDPAEIDKSASPK